MKSRYSLVVVGCGPAGMAAAQCAAEFGVDVALLDEQDRPGGQIYRSVGEPPLPDPGILGRDYLEGRRLAEQMLESRVDYVPGASIWHINEDRDICVLHGGVTQVLRADRVIVAAGAQERPMPLPGWQLPGVMTAGAGQILLKSAATVPAAGVVLAGSGPLLLLLACQYLRAGVDIRALLDTTPRENFSRAARLLPGALSSTGDLLKGLRMIAEIRRGGVPVHHEVSGLSAHGEGGLERIRFNAGRNTVELETGILMLHAGVIPQLHLVMAAGCDIRWSGNQDCWHPVTDHRGFSTIPGIAIAGDGAGIVGAAASELQGRLTALHCLYELGALDQARRDALTVAVAKRLGRHGPMRRFLDQLYRPTRELLAPSDETVVCRCEEVTAGEIREVARLGCTGPNQAKAFTRCGMGPCQGRQCGSTVAALIAEVQGREVSEVGCFRVRPPVKPVSLGQMGGVPPGPPASPL